MGALLSSDSGHAPANILLYSGASVSLIEIYLASLFADIRLYMDYYFIQQSATTNSRNSKISTARYT